MSDSQEEKLWFRRRRYGWGWIPTTWQGYLILALYLILMVAAALIFTNGNNEISSPLGFIISLVVIIGSLIGITYIKGPKPKWRWGKSANDNPDEDF